MTLAQASDQPGIRENEVLDEFRIPFGDWMDQSVDWIATELNWLLDIIEWPFKQLLNLLVDDILIKVPWIYVVLFMFALAWLVRNVKVAAFTAIALTTCGLLGNAYWIETAKTLGFIAVAVILCVAVGIPVGIACGRVDSVWQVVRPILDAMQVVHSFVYMLPFIYFWGIGTVPATMVTMIFALPPLIRLTNLGIRQVPEDVVEAARAYGAPERRVLTDVQLPLARPAIMTGVNQTLLLAISMLGIAAIMGAGGLGSLLFRAIGNQSVELGTSAGLAFFLVAVVLDRISQRDDGAAASLFTRIRLAWTHRVDPEALLPSSGDDGADKVEEATQVEVYAPIDASERTPMAVAAIGGLLAVISVFLTWASDAGAISAFGRRGDEDLPGATFSGLAAEGGSWFGFIVLAAGLFVIASGVKTIIRPGGESFRWLAPDGAAILSLAALISTFAFLVMGTAPAATDPGTGIGVILALIGTGIAAAGSFMWLRIAPHTPLHPLPAGIAFGRIIGAGAAVLILVAAVFSGWSFDDRDDVIITPEIQAEFDRLTQEARDDPENAAVYSAELLALNATIQQADRIITDGKSSDGSQLGIWALGFGVFGAAATLVSAGVFGADDRRRWIGSAATTGLGAGVAFIAVGWIASLVRSSHSDYVSGVGSFLALVAGALIAVSAMSILKEFRRSRVYEDDTIVATVASSVAAKEPEPAMT